MTLAILSHLVTKPDDTFITFDFDGQSLISAVKDTEGKMLEAQTELTAAATARPTLSKTLINYW